MKKFIKLIALVLVLGLVLPMVTSCAQNSDEDGNSQQTGSSQPQGGNENMLTALTVDGGYELKFDAAVSSYEIKIPAGRPRIPKVSAEAANGCTVTTTQAVIPDHAAFGTATVTVTDGKGSTQEYTVKFTKDQSLGFHLQYQDYYKLDVDAEKVAKWESSNEDVLYVYSDGPFMGQVRAEGLSEIPVTVKALAADGSALASLTVDKVVKAPLNVFLITGQSNAAGTYDIPAHMTTAEFSSDQVAISTKPAPGTVLCTDVSSTGSILDDMYDLTVGRAGFSPALGKNWYDLTGEKTLMIQTAVGGAPIEAWMKPEGDVRNTYGNIAANFYETTLNAYNHCLEQINAQDSGYELNRIHAYWLQGETGMASTYNPNKLGVGIGDWDFGSKENILDSQEYFDIFMKNMEYFRDDFHCEFMGILLVRAMQEVCSAESVSEQLLTDLVPARAAQYALHNTMGLDIALVSRVCDIARMTSWSDRTDPGWGLMGCGNLHYNQAGHNLNGEEAAANTFNILYGGEARKAYDIEIITANGRDRLEDNGELQILAGQSTQIAAMVLPMYTTTPNVTYEVADTSVVTIDKFGLITAGENASGKTTTITVKCEAANLEKTIKVKVGTKTINEINYEWNFDKGDLTEKNGLNNLTLSEKTGANAAYSIKDGIYTSTNCLTNFAMEKPVRISSENDWCIEWRGVTQTNSALFGTAGNWSNFMYLAYSVPFEVNNPCRIVGADGTALMIPYGRFADYNTKGMNTWKLQYKKDTGRVTLFMNNSNVVASVQMPASWSAEFTNLFGSYTTEVDVDYWGSIDFVRVSTIDEVISFD